MTSRILILGAGLIGAALAYELTRRGTPVTVIDAGLPAAQASGRSFGWINASFSLNKPHLRARQAAMTGHHRWQKDLNHPSYRWQGCLWWEETGAAFDALAHSLSAQSYPCRALTRGQIADLEPSLAHPPERALLLDSEGAVDAAALTHNLLQHASLHGAQVWQGGGDATLIARDGAVTGVQTAQAVIRADQVILAAGLGTPQLLAPLGLHFAMQQHPGAMLRTHPIAARLRHILAAPDQELRQDATGAILAPATAAHQADLADHLNSQKELVQPTLARLSNLLGTQLHLQSLTLAERPVPGDGLPAVGAVPGISGLFMAVLHSGVTLAPLVAASLAEQILGRDPDPDMAGFAPDRLIGGAFPHPQK